MLNKICVAYLDDVIVFSDSEEEHAAHVAQVLDLLYAAGLRVKIEKCDFGVREMELLGFCFTSKGISPSPNAVSASRI